MLLEDAMYGWTMFLRRRTEKENEKQEGKGFLERIKVGMAKEQKGFCNKSMIYQYISQLQALMPHFSPFPVLPMPSVLIMGLLSNA